MTAGCKGTRDAQRRGEQQSKGDDSASVESITVEAMIEEVNKAMEQITEEEIVPPIVATMKADAAIARTWNYEHRPIRDEEGYTIKLKNNQPTRPSTINIIKMTNIIDGNPIDITTETIAVGEEMDLLGDNDPFVDLMTMIGYLEDHRYRNLLETIEEGEESSGKHYCQDYKYSSGDPHQDHRQEKFKQDIIRQTMHSRRGIYRACVRTQPQNDSGANICITNNKTILVNYIHIKPYNVKGCSDEDQALTCTGTGHLP